MRDKITAEVPLAETPAVRAALAAGFEAQADQDTAALARFLAAAFGPATVALVHYGSHVTAGAESRPGSACDFFVIVDDYDAAYRAVTRAADTGMDPARAVRLARLLAPNVVSVVDAESDMQAKCAVLDRADFLRATSPASPDHFTRGRLFQQVQLSWARDEATRGEVIERLLAVRRGTYAWGRPYLPATFDVAAYCRALLETSFAAEIRPERGNRTAELLAAQAPVLHVAYGALLETLTDAGELLREPDGRSYRLARAVTAAERRALRAYFARSKARATARWAKYIALYDDWLAYILAKIERRGGGKIELTAREQRWPLLFIWPRAIRFLREQARRR